MQDSVLDATNVDVHWQQGGCLDRVKWSSRKVLTVASLSLQYRNVQCLVVGVCESHEIPRRIDKGVHGIGFSLGWTLTSTVCSLLSMHHSALALSPNLLGALAVYPILSASKGRLSFARELDIQRKMHRQVLFRHRHHLTRWTMDHRNRGTPISLS